MKDTNNYLFAFYCIAMSTLIFCAGMVAGNMYPMGDHNTTIAEKDSIINLRDSVINRMDERMMAKVGDLTECAKRYKRESIEATTALYEYKKRNEPIQVEVTIKERVLSKEEIELRNQMQIMQISRAKALSGLTLPTLIMSSGGDGSQTVLDAKLALIEKFNTYK
jgi:hypothetical protein